MKVLLRLKEVDDQTAAKLAMAHCGESDAPHGAEKLYEFIDLKSILFDDGNEAQVDLRLDTDYMPDLLSDAQKEKPVTREMLNPLWDLLGIFPRSGKLPEALEAGFREMGEVIVELAKMIDDFYNADKTQMKVCLGRLDLLRANLMASVREL